MNRLKVVHTVPRWFKEGFAMYYADEISLRHKLNVAEKSIYKKLRFMPPILYFYSSNYVFGYRTGHS